MSPLNKVPSLAECVSYGHLHKRHRNFSYFYSRYFGIWTPISSKSLSHNVHFIHFHTCHLTDILSLAFPTNLVQIHVQPFSHCAAQTETSFYLCRFVFISSPQLFSFPYLQSFACFKFIFRTLNIWCAQDLVKTGFRQGDCKSHF